MSDRTRSRVLDAKWTLLILRELFGAVRRFGELNAALPGVSPKTLTERLRALEARRVVARRSIPRFRHAWNMR